MKLSAKMGLGFGVILMCLLVVAITGYMGMSKLFEGFQQYRKEAKAGDLVGELTSSVLHVLVNANQYLQTESPEALQRYQAEKNHTVKILGETKQWLNQGERLQQIEKIGQSVENYERGFEEVVQLTRQMQEIRKNLLDPNGLVMRQALSDLAQSAVTDQKMEEAYRATNLQEHVMLGRLYTAKYLEDHEASDFQRAYEELTQQSQKKLEALQSTLDPKRQDLLNQVNKARQEYLKAMEALQKVLIQRDKIVKDSLAQIGPEVEDQSEKMMQVLVHSRQSLDELLTVQIGQANFLILTIAVIALILGGSVALGLTRGIVRQVGGEPAQIAQISQEIAQGNLAIELADGGKVATGIYASMKQMTQALNEVMSQVAAAAEQLNGGSGQIAASSQIIAQGASEQAASLEQISASMDQISSQTRMNADNASQANQLAGTARIQAEAGNQQMQKMVEAMDAINKASQNISKIIKTIDEIAFQTNLLAINAAVEAARAGTHGKGFAVVAEEVRNLAQRSATAAKETTAMIEDSIRKVQAGAQIAQETATSLTQIVSGSKKVTDLVGEIAAASVEQSKGVNEIHKGLNQLNQVTQQNAQSSEETAAASEELTGQAQTLSALVRRFRLRQQAVTWQGPTHYMPSMRPSPQTSTKGASSLAHPPVPSSPKEHNGMINMGGTSRPEEVIALSDQEFGRF